MVHSSTTRSLSYTPPGVLPSRRLPRPPLATPPRIEPRRLRRRLHHVRAGAAPLSTAASMVEVAPAYVPHSPMGVSTLAVDARTNGRRVLLIPCYRKLPCATRMRRQPHTRVTLASPLCKRPPQRPCRLLTPAEAPPQADTRSIQFRRAPGVRSSLPCELGLLLLVHTQLPPLVQGSGSSLSFTISTVPSARARVPTTPWRVICCSPSHAGTIASPTI